MGHPKSLSNVVYRLPELDPTYYDLANDATVSYEGIINVKEKQGPILHAVEFLKSAYCGSIGAEFCHLQVYFLFLLLDHFKHILYW